MKVGIPKEIKNNENRVGITPAGVEALKAKGHDVWIESGAGLGSNITDEEYKQAGAQMTSDVAKIWSADMVMKVKEPLKEEYQYFRKGLILFTYLHLAPEKELTQALRESGVIAVAYETIQLADGSLPLLAPMSEIAGRMAVQIGAQFLEEVYGGKGILLGGVPGVRNGKVVIVGGGVAGLNAAKIAVGLGARVVILDVNVKRLAYLDDLFGGRVQTVISNSFNIAEEVKDADLVIGAVLITGSKAPTLVSKEMVESMSKGSVLVDIAIDQGGIFETTDQITTHDHPTYEKYGVIHYAVANMPGAVPRTSTFALTNVTLPYALQIADKGILAAAQENEALKRGINIIEGEVTYPAVALSQGIDYTNIDQFLSER